MIYAIPYVLLGLLGLCVGSFCNVLIFRLPRGEEFVKTPSHCMSCGHRLKWFELIPLLSWLMQRGRCRACGEKISPQYPIVEGLNAALWLLSAALTGLDPLRTALYCAMCSLLLVLSFIDWRTFEIPDGLILALALLGAVQLAADWQRHWLYLIGMVAVSVPLLLLWLLSGGAGVGLGDVKLMAAAGLLLGWQRILLALIAGCVCACAVHLPRMRRGAGRKLAFGPYLSVGIGFSALLGEQLLAAYLSMLGL